MKVSVALCTYNGAQYLQEQLESIAKQKRLPDELVVCDDRSQDNTVEIVESFASRVPFLVRLISNKQNLGSTKNFEHCIGLCTGDIIVLSDQDDVWQHDKLERIYEIFSTESHKGAVFTDANIVDEHLNPLKNALWESIEFTKSEQKRFAKGKTVEVLVKHNVVTGATMAFRSEFKDLILPIPSTWVHDGWIALLVAYVSDLAIIPEPLILYRQHPKQQVGAGYSSRSILIKIQINVSKLIKRMKENSNVHQERFNQYKLAYERLIYSQSYSIKKEELFYLEAKIKHLQKRANMPKNRLIRLHIVIKELVKLNYHRYSYGIYSFCEDIIR